MRLAIFTSGTYPYHTHGAEIGIFYLARNLTLLNNEVTLYLSELTPKEGAVESVELPTGMRVVYSKGIPMGYIYNVSFILAALLGLRKRSEKPTLVVVNIPTILSLTAAYLTRLLLRVPYLVIIHGPPDIEITPGIAQRLQWYLIRKAARIVCVSQDLAHSVEKNCIRRFDDVDIIPNGYDEWEIQQALDWVSEVTNRPQVIFVGSLDENKDPMTLITSFKVVSKSIPGALLNLVGSGPLESSVRGFVAQERLQSSVIFHGYMKHSELLRLLAQCSLLVVTSHQEGMPTVVIEALALGKPVVASAVGGLLEIISDGENGYLVRPGEAERLAEHILQILTDEDLRNKMSTAAKQTALNYKWSHITELYVNLFHSILNSQLR